ncbi:MAG: HAD family acid phosphatase [Myxococcota bacterium]|nr:HAD family acid phosphatase [Myxococcota bacterium]
MTSENLDTILWVQQSAEYRIATRQSYALASERLRQALQDPHCSAVLAEEVVGGTGQVPNRQEVGGEGERDRCLERPAAVILDVDETVLDNAAFDAKLLAEQRPFEWSAWNEWLSGDHGEAIEGAAEFLEEARALGVRVYFVTNREQRYEQATRQNLTRLGLFDEASGDTLLCRGAREDWTQDKASRRGWVASQAQVLLLIGDDLNDFVSTAGRDNAQRRALAQLHAARWGQSWILIPSPVYGSWLGAIVSDDELDAETRRARKRAALRLED